ncbi:MAG: hypothetical protein DME50_17145 [Verrucomicrobia bacterium]|nr:MAG: hypothetical protein DME50_17145 [Verrucomicrobiota bacterium]
MSPGLALATFDTAGHPFYAGKDKILLNFHWRRAFSAFWTRIFSLGRSGLGRREQNVGITYVGGCEV